MKIHHIAIWTFHLEKLREFYTRYFNGTSNENTLIPKKVLNLTSFHLKVVLH
jgi:catechol 2,3-dioxygenase-like lactoylglutathione lyase family enzyme